MSGARFRFLIVVAAVLACASPAYAFRTLIKGDSGGRRPHEWPQDNEIVHWDLREFESCKIPWTVSRVSFDLPGEDLKDQIRIAFSQWEDVEPARIRFVETDFAGAPPVAFALDGYNTIAWNDTALWQDAILTREQIPALTFTWWERSSGRIIESDIRLNENFWWSIADHEQQFLDSPLLRADIRTIVLHEIGHFIGLAHPSKALESDTWDLNTGPVDDFPGPGDIDRNNDGTYDAPVMYALSDRWSRWHLWDDDRDGCNFLYNPDLGDAPDPWNGTFNEYPTLVHGTLPGPQMLNLRPRYIPAYGAEHLFGIRPRQPFRNYSYEWLGFPFAGSNSFSSECEANLVDADPFDDGVTITPNPTLFRKPVTIVDWVHIASDARGNGHDYLAHPLSVNTWIDLDMNGVWIESERVIEKAFSLAPPSGPNATYFTAVEQDVMLPALLAGNPRPMWLRTRLDWGENAGDQANRDGTLATTRGAAQFGEVEDYPIRMLKPTRQLIVTNGTGAAAGGVTMVLPGPAVPGQSYQQHVTGGDCAAGGFPGSPASSYDAGDDETSILFGDLIDPGARVHVGRAQTAAPAQALRAFWNPLVGPPGIDHQIPVTNAAIYDLGGAAGRRTRVVVGAPNDSVGGVIGGSPLVSQWNDSMYVSVFARIAPGPIPLENLSLCHPSVNSLLPEFLGNAWITPDRPFVAYLSEAMTSGTLVLEVHSNWSVNANTSTELLSFDDVVPVGVPPAVAPSVAGFGLRAMPTPATRQTSIGFTLPRAGRVTLRVYDVSGALRSTVLRDFPMAAGAARHSWEARGTNGEPLPAGVYFLNLDVDGARETAPIVLIR